MKKSVVIIIILITVAVLTPALVFLWWFPSEKEIRGCMKTKMFSVELCPGSKNYVKLSNISKNLQNSILLTEDSAFYQHNGFDSEGIERCFEKMREKGKVVCGGSTITQQLAKNMFLSKTKSFTRKALEALITIKLEKTLTKKEILERYLNVVQFGKNIFGVQQAASFYFKKTPAQLTLPESAFLAMVLPNPEKYSQSYYRKELTSFAKKRLNQIVNDLYQYKKISEEEYLTASDQIDFFLKSGLEQPKDHLPDEPLTEKDLQNLDDVVTEEMGD